MDTAPPGIIRYRSHSFQDLIQNWISPGWEFSFTMLVSFLTSGRYEPIETGDLELFTRRKIISSFPLQATRSKSSCPAAIMTENPRERRSLFAVKLAVRSVPYSGFFRIGHHHLLLPVTILPGAWSRWIAGADELLPLSILLCRQVRAAFRESHVLPPSGKRNPFGLRC